MILRFASSFLLLGASIAAQTPVTVRCTPTDGSPGFQTVIKWNGTQLHSATINLVPFHDLDVVLHGTWNGAVVEVTSIQTDLESFSIGGNGHIGNKFTYSTVGAPGGLAINLAGLLPSFLVPLGDLALQLDPFSMAILGAGPLDGGGEFSTDLDIPNDPALVGARVYGQGVVLEVGGGIYTTNIDTKVVS